MTAFRSAARPILAPAAQVVLVDTALAEMALAAQLDMAESGLAAAPVTPARLTAELVAVARAGRQLTRDPAASSG